MMVRWLLASVHLVALGVGLGAVVARAALLRGPLADLDIRRVLAADSAWGLAAVLWISTGLLRAFAGFEKGSSYYLHNPWFLAKMGLLALILLLEVRPMTSLIRWRVALKAQRTADTSRAGGLARASALQAVLVIAMVFAAAAMARGFGS